MLEPSSAGEAGASEFQWDEEPDEEIRWGRATLRSEPGQAEQGSPSEPQEWDREPSVVEPGWGNPPAWGPESAGEELVWETGADWDTDQAPPPAAQEAPAQPRWGAPPPAQPEPAAPPQAPGGSDPLGELLKGEDAVTGLLPLGALLGRTGRMLGAAVPGGGALAMVVLELGPADRVDDGTLRAAANALRGELRFDDPVARIGPLAFAAVIPLIQGSSDVPGLEGHLADTVRRALAQASVEVRSAHTLASLDERQDAHDLLRVAVTKLRVE